VGLLLHLSDLHLSADHDSDVTGDYKVDVLELADKENRTSRIRSSLRALGTALVAEGKLLDAVVVTGDVTSQNGQTGFDLLPSVLGELGAAFPAPEKVLVVPGNHDVAWGTKSSSSDRYVQFVKLRSHGYVTALLEGVDFDATGRPLGSASLKDPVVAAEDGTFVVVGLNSSNHCGVQTNVESALQPHVDKLNEDAKSDEGTRQLLKAWAARGLYDMARVDRGQLRIGSEALKRTVEAATAHAEPVRVVALHHQLLPVSTSEEVKPFESLTNLAAVRDWLAGNDVDVVLHGHKHQGLVTEDVFVPHDGPKKGGSHRVLVISAPTIGHGAPTTSPVGRLIEFSGSTSRQYPAQVADVPSVNDGVPVNLVDLTWNGYILGGDDHLRTGIIRQHTAEQVHARLMAVRDRLDEMPSPLVCRFTDGASALQIPADYPDLPVDHAERQSWFSDTVAWWQAETSGQSAPFNHGERLRRFGPGALDQAVKAVDSLLRDAGTSRAIAVLVDPHHDLSTNDVQFPAFVLVQFIINNSKLDVLGFFRKQEMPHWWPINAGELAQLQAWVVAELAARGKHVVVGSITTVTSLPVAGRSVPRVAVPFLEREMEGPGGLLGLILPLVISPTDVDARARCSKLWLTAMEDWKPGSEPAADGDPVPVKSLRQLREIVDQVSMQGHRAEELATLKDLLTHLSSVNENYSVSQQQNDRRARHEAWRRDAVPLIDRLLVHVNSMLEGH
jgi:3',5'-cyclic AMP phosphodiesterase CpdA